MKITEISYSQTVQAEAFHPINISATAIVNEGENQELAMAELKLFVLTELTKSVNQYRESKKPKIEAKKPIVNNDSFPDFKL